ncbi:MAG: DnaD domain protein [Clostridia bacterium]|nr:DnaD domain protein [Clostridia bacterium]
MAYSINPAAFGEMFAVPGRVVDDYIKLASPVQLKAMLWIFRHASEPVEPERIAPCIGYSAADVADALVALCEWNVLISDGKKAVAPSEPEKSPEKAQSAKAPLPEIQPVRPSYEQIIRRCKESPQINDMFNDIQQILGKTIGYDGQSVLIMMHDQYGLPFEVIYMLADYCVSIGKSNFAYMAKVGRDWGEREIDTLEKADEQIKILRSCNSVWQQFAQMAGIQNPRPTSSQSAYLRTWTVDMKFSPEMIFMAYEEMMDHSSRISFAYMNKVLNNWYGKGIKTPEQVEQEKREYRESKAKNTKPQEGTASFDMDEFKRRADKLPVYKKGE